MTGKGPSREGAALAARLMLGGVFVYAGYVKLIEPAESFAAVLEGYRLLPFSWLLPAARVFPWIEYILGGAVIAGCFTRLAAGGLGAMLLSFIGVFAISYFRGIDLSQCGCFGRSGPQISPGMEFLMDVILLGSAVWVLKSGGARWSLDAWIGKKASPPRP